MKPSRSDPLVSRLILSTLTVTMSKLMTISEPHSFFSLISVSERSWKWALFCTCHYNSDHKANISWALWCLLRPVAECFLCLIIVIPSRMRQALIPREVKWLIHGKELVSVELKSELWSLDSKVRALYLSSTVDVYLRNQNMESF